MAEEEKKEDQFGFTPEGEEIGYVDLDGAAFIAMKTARDTPGEYGSGYQNIPMAFELSESRETEDHYVVTLSFRPQGDFAGTPGHEQLYVTKEGLVDLRQVLGLPRLPGKSRLPVILVGVGAVVVVVIAAIVVVGRGFGGGDGGGMQAAAPLPTDVPLAAVAPLLEAIPSPAATPRTPATSIPVVAPTETAVTIEATHVPVQTRVQASPPTLSPTPVGVYATTPIPTPSPTKTSVPSIIRMPTPTPSPTPKPARTSIRAVGDMHQGRGWEDLPPHLRGIVRLEDGRILVTGGDCKAPGLSSAEIFDRATETWSLAACLNDGRRRHTTTLLADGRVLVTGGEGIVGPPTCEKIVTPVSGDRPRVLDTTTLNSAMHLLCLTGPGAGTELNRTTNLHGSEQNIEKNSFLQEAEYAVGPRRMFGFGKLDTAEIYDPRTNTWTIVGTMTHPRENHTATLLRDGRVLIVGGFFHRFEDGEIAEIFDPATQEFYSFGANEAWMEETGVGTPIGKAYHSAALLPDGRVMIVGGIPMLNDVGGTMLFDPTTGKFAKISGAGRGYVIPMVLEDDYVLMVTKAQDGVSINAYDMTGLTPGANGVSVGTAANPTPFILKDGSGRILGYNLAWAFMYDPESVRRLGAKHISPRSRVRALPLHPEERRMALSAAGFGAVDLGNDEILILGGSDQAFHIGVRHVASTYIVKLGACWVDKNDGSEPLVCAGD